MPLIVERSGWLGPLIAPAPPTPPVTLAPAFDTPPAPRARAWQRRQGSSIYTLTDDAIVASRFYSTDFLLNETTLTEDGGWLNGLTDGLLWNDVRTDSGAAFGTQITTAPSGPPYDDSGAIRKGLWPRDHGARQRIKLNGSGTTGTFHESLLWVRTAISANVFRGYECNYAWNGAYCEIALWTAAGGGGGGGPGFAGLLVAGTPTGALADGDILEATAIGNVISFYRNGVLLAQYTDTSTGGNAMFLDGAPGIGWWRRSGTGLPPRLMADHFEAFSL